MAVKNLPEVIGKAIAGFFKWVWGGITSLFAKIADFVKNNMLNIINIIVTLIFPIAGIAMAVVRLVIKHWEKIKEFFIGLWENIKNIFSAVGEWFGSIFRVARDAVITAFTGIGNFFAVLWDGIKNMSSAAWEDIKNIFSGIGEWFGAKFTAARDAVMSVFSGIGSFFHGVFGGIKETAGAVAGFFSSRWKDAVEGVKTVSSGIGGFFKKGFEGAKETLFNWAAGAGEKFNMMKDKASTAAEFLKGAFDKGLDAVGEKFPVLGRVIEKTRDIFSAAGNVMRNVFDAVGKAVKLLLWPIETVVKVVKAFFTGGITGAIDAVKEQFSVLGERFMAVFDAVKNVIKSVAEFMAKIFEGPIQAVKTIIEGIKNVFSGVFDAVKEKIQAFVDFFKDKFAVVQNVIDGVGKFLGSAKDFFTGGGKEKTPQTVTRNIQAAAPVVQQINQIPSGGGMQQAALAQAQAAKTVQVAAHAAGGIFTRPHIAQIAEKGAEAVVPLSKTPQGFEIWKQAGELGGYLERLGKQAVTGTAASSQPETPPVMQAAAQTLSAGDNVIHITFTQQNTFNGSASDKETVNQISIAGQKAVDELEVRFASLIKEWIRNKERTAYA
jgi:phage-related protein